MTRPRSLVAPESENETPLATSSTKTKTSANVALKATAVTTFEPCSKAKRAAMWLLPKTTEMVSSRTMPSQRGIGFACNALSPLFSLRSVGGYHRGPRINAAPANGVEGKIAPMGQYGIGQPVSRFEDPRLLRGQGRYINDVNLPGQAYLVYVRSPHAHAAIRSIDFSDALNLPGVIGVYTSHDLARAGLGTIQVTLKRNRPDGSPMFARTHRGLA